MIHVNSNLFYILRGGNDSTSWTQVNGQWPFIVNLTNNDCTIGGTGAAVSDFRAPIFYDSGDTGYYLDPAGTSNLRHTRIFPSAVTNDVWNNSIEIREVNGVTNTQTGSDYAPSIYFHWSNIAAAAIKMYSDGHIRIRAQSTTNTDYRNVYMASLFANIFYDNNNTGYYVDPASTSVLNNVYLDGTVYMRGTEASQTLTDAATIAWDTNSGRIATVTLGASRTMGAPTNAKVGTYVLYVIQGGTGSYNITWNSVFKWPGGVAPTLSTAVGRRDIFTFIYDGTNFYGSYINDVR
jgi:hypothetical protein